MRTTMNHVTTKNLYLAYSTVDVKLNHGQQFPIIINQLFLLLLSTTAVMSSAVDFQAFCISFRNERPWSR